MARTQIPFGGFKLYTPPNGMVSPPKILAKQVATSYGTAIFFGDPVKKVSDGTVSISAAGENVYGIVDWVRYQDAAGRLIERSYVQASTAYTVDRLRTVVGVIIAYPGVWFEVCTNASIASVTTARTYPDENCNHVATAAGNTGTGRSGYQLDIGTHATTANQWRLIDLVDDPLNDATQTQHRWIVECNLAHNLPGSFSTTGI